MAISGGCPEIDAAGASKKTTLLALQCLLPNVPTVTHASFKADPLKLDRGQFLNFGRVGAFVPGGLFQGMLLNMGEGSGGPHPMPTDVSTSTVIQHDALLHDAH